MLTRKFYIILSILAVILLGLLIFFYYFKDDKIYTLKSYYPNTKVTDISHYLIKNGDTIFHGKFIQYNENGNKIAEGNFINNQVNGKCIYYFDSGNIETIVFKKNSKVKEGIWNYPSGNLERYIMFDEFDNPVFIIRYDELGNVKKHDGFALIETYQYKIANSDKFKIKINQYLKLGDTLTHKYILANIPNATRRLKIKLIDANLLGHRSKITNEPPTGIDAKNILTTKGLNAIKATVEYKFNDKNKTVIKDSIYFEIKVN